MFFKQKSACQTLSMGEAARELKSDGLIRLIDVRTEEEYRSGHIPGSINLPLNRISEITRLLPDKGERIFVYCLSGARSQAACGHLVKMGYENVTNIGSISQWAGPIERTAGA